jgi:hypothetical protein
MRGEKKQYYCELIRNIFQLRRVDGWAMNITKSI